MSDLGAIEEVDDLANPRQSQLALVTMLKVCRRAVKQARDGDPEDALDKFTRCIYGLLPADAATQTLDGWTRMGAHAGALAGWHNLNMAPMRGAPSGDHALLYGAAWTLSSGIVFGVRHGG